MAVIGFCPIFLFSSIKSETPDGPFAEMRPARPFVVLNLVATQTLMPVEQYLRTVYKPDAEFVDGEIVERNSGENPHSEVRVRLVEIFYELKKKHPVHCRTELRMRLAPARIRIPDVALFHSEKPVELVPSDAPLVVVEIVSREDRHTEIIQKFEEYRAWGVTHIWLADPWQRQLSVYGDNGLTTVGSLQISDLGLEITASDLFD